MSTAKSVHDFTVKDISGNDVSLSEYKDKVLLIVNVASKCGFTPQYDGLQLLYDKYRDQGFEVLAFPCNQFGGQEPGPDDQVCKFVREERKATFPLFAKVDVNGGNADPLWLFLQREQSGFMWDGIKWNFTKFLVDRSGKPIKRYSSVTKPGSIASDIESALSKE